MATKVTVGLSKGTGEFAKCEISAGTDYTYGNGTHPFVIGNMSGNIHFLTVSRRSAGNIKIAAVDGDLLVSVDGGKDKKVSKGKSLSLSSHAKRALVREKG